MPHAPDTMYSFLKGVRGSWRNAIYLYCGRSRCPSSQQKRCGGCLMTADANGVPILVSAKAFEAFSGETIDPSECSGVLDKRAFDSAYALAILWHSVSSSDCPLRAFEETRQTDL